MARRTGLKFSLGDLPGVREAHEEAVLVAARRNVMTAFVGLAQGATARSVPDLPLWELPAVRQLVNVLLTRDDDAYATAEGAVDPADLPRVRKIVAKAIIAHLDSSSVHLPVMETEWWDEMAEYGRRELAKKAARKLEKSKQNGTAA